MHLLLILSLLPPPAPADQTELVKLAENAYAEIVSPDGNAVSNSGFVVLEDSVLVYDAHFTPEGGHALVSRIRSVTPKPIRYLVLSHFHPDHTHGSQAFGEVRQIISSAAARRDMLHRDLPAMRRATAGAESQIQHIQRELAATRDEVRKEQIRKTLRSRQEFLERMSRLNIQAPVVAVEDSLVLMDRGKRIEIVSTGAGHTDGDLILFLPSSKVVFAGDVFFNSALPNTQDASILSWIKSLGELLKLNADTFVPGHGPVGGKDDVRRFLSYLEELKSMVEAGVKRGDTLEQVLRDCRVPPRFEHFQFQNFFPANVQSIYMELRALQLATPAESGGKPEETRKP
jgi:glyoxylase-like metal-dependent hydrolase (beta-lactamase superfamily II)